MADLSYEERKRLRRAAEDARDACNRHYGPFVDVVAHPLNILSLLDMAQANDASPLVTALQVALDALEYHQEQTRPIERTAHAISTVRTVLGARAK